MILLLLMVHILVPAVTPKCSFLHETFRCEATDDTFLDEFYEFLPDDLPAEFSIDILNSQWTVIEYFPSLFVNNDMCQLKNLAIRHSGIENISRAAFEELEDLESLDLSWNFLVDLSFLELLSVRLRRLYLNNNRISDLAGLFSRFNVLEVLDISGNQIIVLSFNDLFSIRNIDLSSNLIATIEPCNSLDIAEIPIVDLSFNNITEFDEAKLRINVDSLDLSYNPLRSIMLSKYFYRSKLNICNTSLHLVDELCEVGDLILSSNEINIINLSNVENIYEIIIKDSNLSNLSCDSIDIFGWRRKKQLRIDLSNLSIKAIEEQYFQDVQVRLLNFSYNDIDTLRRNMFAGSIINLVDFSHSNIKYLTPGVFNDAVIQDVNLSFNQISSVRNIFHNVRFFTINLSFNRITVLHKDSFVNCTQLTELILSKCLIDRIEENALVNMSILKLLDLSYNKLLILETNTFHELPIEVLKLQGNQLKTIRAQAFNNLPSLWSLNLSGMQIDSLEMRAFSDMPSLETVDLRNNDISVIPPNLFEQTSNLSNLELTGNSITLLNKFSNKLKLKKLSLSYNGSFTADRISNFNLEYLSVPNSSIDVLENDSFKRLYNLKELHFAQTDVFFVGPGALNDLYSLQFLDAHNLFKHIKHLKPNTFVDLRSLRTLNLSELHLETIERGSFTGLKKLEYLLVSHNNLTNLSEGVFTGLKLLEVLDLSHNELKSLGGGVFEALTSLKSLNLESNKLSTVDSFLLASVTLLEVLNLSSNNISYIAERSFSQLVKLRELLLQNNRITKMPIGSLQYLSHLEILNLSYNPFELFENGVFSNLRSLLVLDLTNTSLFKLEEESILFSMTNLEKLYLDRNYLKQIDLTRYLVNLKKLNYVGISHNKWKCSTLSRLVEIMNNKTVQYQPSAPVYDSHNIDGVKCIDICEFVYCSPERGEPIRDQ